MIRKLVSIAALLAAAAPASAQIDARMFRQPDVSADADRLRLRRRHLGGAEERAAPPTRLSSPPGEESFPRFSPDGTKIAYSANYDGNTDVYVVPVARRRAGAADASPDGRSRASAGIPTASACCSRRRARADGSATTSSISSAVDGGLPEKLPVPYGEFGAFSPDGTRFVYMPMSQDFRTWKRYRGGWAPDLWLFDLKTFASRNITQQPGQRRAADVARRHDLLPLRPRRRTSATTSGRCDVATGARAPGDALQRLRHHLPVDRPGRHRVPGRRPALPARPGDREGDAKCRSRSSPIARRCGRAPRRPTTLISDASVSPTGKRAVFEARGDVFTVPAEYGAVVNVTRSLRRRRALSALVARRQDARLLERSQRRVRADAAAGRRHRRRDEGHVARPGFRYRAAVVARQQEARVHRSGDADPHLRRSRRGKVTEVDQSPDWIAHGGLEAFRFAVVARLALAHLRAARRRPATTRSSSTTRRPAKLHQATSGYFNDTQPVFDPEGKYLFYASRPRVRAGLRQLRQHRGPIRTRRSSSPCRCARTSSRRSPRATTPRAPIDADKTGRRRRTDKKDDEEATKKPRTTRSRRRSTPRAGQRRHRSRRLRGARRRAAAEGRQLRRPAGDQGQAALPPRAAHRLGRREEPDRLLRPRGARGEDGARRCRRRSR